MMILHVSKNISCHRIGENNHTPVLEHKRATQPGSEDQLLNQLLIGTISNRPFKSSAYRIR